MKTGKYRHYKGDFYEVLGTALHTETNEKLVIYKALYELRPELTTEYGADFSFVRPYDMFFETVEIDGKMIQRFEYVGDMTAQAA